MSAVATQKVIDVIEELFEACKKPAVLEENQDRCAMVVYLKSLYQGRGSVKLRPEVARRTVDKLLSGYSNIDKESLRMSLLRYVGALVGELTTTLGEYATVEAVVAQLLRRLLEEDIVKIEET